MRLLSSLSIKLFGCQAVLEKPLEHFSQAILVLLVGERMPALHAFPRKKREEDLPDHYDKPLTKSNHLFKFLHLGTNLLGILGFNS